MSLEATIEAQREALMVVHPDQEKFLDKLLVLKRNMMETKIMYGGYE